MSPDPRQTDLPVSPLQRCPPLPVSHPGPCHGCGAEGVMYGVIAEEWLQTAWTEGALVRPAALGPLAPAPDGQLPLPGVVPGKRKAPAKPVAWVLPPGERNGRNSWAVRPLCLECTRAAVGFFRAYDVPVPPGYGWA